MENVERFTPLYAIVYVITNSMENLRFDKEDYFHVLVFFKGYFIKEIENISPVSPYVIETLVEVWENSKLRGNTRPAGLMFSLQFLVVSNFHSCFYNYMETIL